MNSGDSVYFCFTIKNTSPVTLTEQTLIDANLGLTATLNYDIPPGGELRVNNALLAESGYSAMLGPVEVTGDIVNTVVVSTPYEETTSATRANAVVRLSPTSLEELDQPQLDLFLPLINQ